MGSLIFEQPWIFFGGFVVLGMLHALLLRRLGIQPQGTALVVVGAVGAVIAVLSILTLPLMLLWFLEHVIFEMPGW